MSSHNRFWTKERLVWMHDVALPKNYTVAEAMRAAELKWNRTLSRRAFEMAFVAAYAKGPATLTATDTPTRDPGEALPQDNPKLLKKQIRSLERQLKDALEASEAAHVIDSILYEGLARIQEPPSFIVKPPPRTSKIFHGIPTLFLSDVHHGEMVSKREMGGCNEFNMMVSRKRLERIFQRAVYLVDNVLTPSEYPGIVVAMGGDMVSGNIHDEIRETNERPIFEVVLDLVDTLRAGILYLLDRFPKVYVPCVCGNHGRLDRKPRNKRGPQDNYEYILYHMLKRSFIDDPRVHIDVADTFVHHYSLLGTRYALTHGDQFPGGAGIAGVATPIALGDHKLRKQLAAIESWTGIPSEYDVLLLGHFHQLNFMRTIIMNGSVKGFDEYAKKKNFAFEPPQQAMWMTTPDRGVSIPMPLFAEDPPKRLGVPSKQWLSVLA